MRELCRIAVSRGYKKVEWHCLEWNEPSNRLYIKLNATQKNDWISYRLFGEALRNTANETGEETGDGPSVSPCLLR